MQKIFTGLMALIVLLSFSFTVAEANDVEKLNDLIEKGSFFNRQTVTVQGEAIGEALERNKYAWVNINDQTNAMGIWMKLDDAKKIKFFGDYTHKGDIIKVSGVFNRACKEHGGDMDIHGTTVEIVEKGHEVKEDVSAWKMVVGVVLTLITLCIAGFYYYRIKRNPSSP